MRGEVSWASLPCPRGRPGWHRPLRRRRPGTTLIRIRGGPVRTPPQDNQPNVHLDPRRSQMSTARETTNKATTRRLYDAMITGDAEIISKTIDEVVEPNVLYHAPNPTGAAGTQLLKQVWPVLLRAFPDLHVAVEDVIAEGDKVVCRDTVTGTHQGEYRGLPPTGKSVTYNEIFILRFAGGRIAEIWGVVDVFSQMQQLGT